MRKRDKTFCVYVAQGKSLEEASILSGYEESKGVTLITKPEIIKEITTLLKAKANLMKNLSVIGYQQLAFGSIADCISLVTEENVSKEDLQNMNLFMISEIKKPKDGAMEIKFFDRIKACEKLAESESSGEGGLSFFAALEKGAENLAESGDNG